jgi:hypothetical protein
MSTFTSRGVRLRRGMANGASGAFSDAAPYAFIVYIVFLD